MVVPCLNFFMFDIKSKPCLFPFSFVNIGVCSKDKYSVFQRIVYNTFAIKMFLLSSKKRNKTWLTKSAKKLELTESSGNWHSGSLVAEAEPVAIILR